MGRLWYTLGVRMYGILLHVASLWHGKARAWVRGRKGWRAKLQTAMGENTAPVVWFHCASLGEFEQGRPLMEAFLDHYPAWRLVVSFFSPSGYEVRHRYELAHCVCYLPLDSSKNARDFLAIVRPRCAFFVKYEVWYHYLAALQAQSVPVYLISAFFPSTHWIFRSGGWYQRLYQYFTHIFVQDEGSLQRLQRIGFEQVSVSGDTRFDRVRQATHASKRLPIVEAFAGSNQLLVLGSTWTDDEKWLYTLLSSPDSIPSGWKVVLVPHEVGTQRIDALIARLPHAVRYSQSSTEEAKALERISSARILVVDTVGLLLSIYAYASLAYVGGGYRTGLHNTLEPAAYGVGVVMGIRNESFLEAVGLVEAGAAVAVEGKVLASTLRTLMGDDTTRHTMGQHAQAYVDMHVGASTRILNHLAQNKALSKE